MTNDAPKLIQESDSPHAPYARRDPWTRQSPMPSSQRGYLLRAPGAMVRPRWHPKVDLTAGIHLYCPSLHVNHTVPNRSWMDGARGMNTTTHTTDSTTDRTAASSTPAEHQSVRTTSQTQGHMQSGRGQERSWESLVPIDPISMPWWRKDRPVFYRPRKAVDLTVLADGSLWPDGC